MGVEALPSSKLGTLEHWDDVYEREIKNFDDIGDEGEVWFGEDAVQRMVDFVEGGLEDGDLPESLTILDIGSGNGHLLFALLELDVPAIQPQNMLGIDYSTASIELSRRIGLARGDKAAKVAFQQVDFLTDVSSLSDRRFNLFCDKGTLDAIALYSAPKEDGDPVARYVNSLSQITKPGDYFLITSCNFTEQELGRIFEQDFGIHHVVPVPSFTFGGQKGSTAVTIAFRRR